MKVRNLYIILICWLAACASMAAASEAEYGKLSYQWTLHADGSREFRHYEELTLFTHTAMNSTYGESFIRYNPKFQEVKIHASYTKQKDGTIIQTPDNAFVEVLPAFAANAPAYNHLKELVVVHTGLELGATIYLDYSILTRPGYYPELDLAETIQQTSPVKHCELTLIVPEGKPLAYDLLGNTTSPSVKSEKGTKRIHWTLHNLPALSREPFQPATGKDKVMLFASTYDTPRSALARFAQACEESRNFEAKAFAQYLAEGAATDQEKLERIANHVCNNIATAPVPARYNGFHYRDADEVLRSAYGTPTEKAILLHAMLNAADIQSRLLLTIPRCVEADACGLQAISGSCLEAIIDGNPLYLSATTSGEQPITWRGDLDRIYTPAGEKVTVTPRPVELKVIKSVKADASKAIGGTVICELPVLSEGVDNWHVATLNSRRTTHFELPSLLNEQVTYTVIPEKGMKLLTATGEESLTQPFGKVTRTLTWKGDTLEVVRTLELNKLQLTPAEYTGLRTLLNHWSDPAQRVLLFSAE